MPDTCDLKFEEAMDWLRKRNIPFRRTSSYQLKIGSRVSYYPGKGTIYLDNETTARPETGLDALEVVLRDERLLRTSATPPRSPRGTDPNTDPRNVVVLFEPES
jgi:hypothetical protein